MAGSIKGLTIEIGGNTAPLEKALKDTNKEISSTQKELKEVNKLLKLDPTNTELVKQKQQLLGEQIKSTTTKLNTLKEAQKQLDQTMKNGGEVNQKEYRELQRQIAQAENSLKDLKQQAKDCNPNVQKLKEGLQEVGEKAKGIAKEGVDLLVEGVKVLSATAVACGLALVKMGVDAGKSADDLNTLSAQTGLTTEQLQKFQYASDLIDVDMSTLTGALKKTTSAMNSAKSGTGKYAEAYKKLGVNIKNADGSLRNNNDVFNESIKALGKIENETERDALAMDLFGKSATELNPLIKGGIDTLDEMGKKAEELGLVLSQDALDGANKFNDQIDMIKANGQGLFTKIGNQVANDLLPTLETVNKKFEKVVGRLSKGLDKNGLKGLVDELIAMFNEIDWGEVAKTLSETIANAFNGISDFLGEVDWSKVGASIVEFLSNIDWGSIIQGVFNIIGGIIGGAGQFLGGAFGKAKEGIENWWNTELEKAGGDGGKAFLNGTKDAIINSGSFLYDNIGQPIAQGIADALDIDTDIPNFHKLTQELGIWWEDLKYKWQNNVLLPIETWWYTLLDDTARFFKGIIDKFQEFGQWVSKIPQDIANFFTGIWNDLTTWFSNLGTKIWEFFEGIGKSVIEFFTVKIPEYWKSFVEWCEKIPEKVQNFGKRLVEGLWNGIKNAKDWLLGKIEEWCGSVLAGFKAFFGIESPSKVMANVVGNNLALGIGKGFEKTMPRVINEMQEKLSNVTEAFKTEFAIGDIPQIEGNKIITENSYVTKNYSNTIETIRQPQNVELLLDGTKLARVLINPLNSEYNRLGVKI